jgi:hypothetical protein
MITIFVKYTVNLLIQFVYEFALENARIAVLDSKSFKNGTIFWAGRTPKPPFSPET